MTTPLTVDELADRWHCSTRAIGDMIRRGDLRASKIAGRWLIEEDDAATYKAAHTNVAPVAPRTRRPRARRSA